MRKKLLFITFLMLLCSTMFGQNGTHWSAPAQGDYSNSMSLMAIIQIDGENQARADLEIAAFHNGVCRGTTRSQVLNYNGEPTSVIILTIRGDYNGEDIKFKLYVPDTDNPGEGKELVTDLVIPFEAGKNIGNINPEFIDFYEVHWSSDVVYYQTMTVGCIINIDGDPYNGTDVELAAFCGEEVRGVAKPIYWEGPNIYYTSLIVGGNANAETISFKLYHPEYGELETDYTVPFENGATIVDENGMPVSINFLYNASYVAQIDDAKYTSFEDALTAAEDSDEIILLENITLEENPTVVSKDINIYLNSKTVSGTIKLAHTGATVTGVAEAMTVTSGVEGYIVVCENNVYSLSERQPSGQVAYRAYINDSESREAVQVDLTNVYAKTSFVVELLDANDNVLTTTSLKAGGVDAESYTCNIVLWGTASGSWDTEIKASELTVANIPTTIKVYADNNLVDTFDNALGAGTNVDETAKYKALDCVYKEAKIGETLYATFAAAYEKAATGNEIILLANVDFAETTVSKDININLNNNTVTGTIVLANTGATVTCTEGAVNVTTSLAGYEVVYESGVYKLVRRQASAEVAYRAYVHDETTFEGLGVDLQNVYAEQSLKVELYSGEQLLTSTTYAKDNYPIDNVAFTCLIVLDGATDEYWNTTIECSELTVANIPTTIKVYADNNLVDTFTNALGAGTNVDETEDYKALDCVLDAPVAKVGNTEYYNINNAIANWTAGSTLTLLADVTLSDVITLKSTEHHILNLDKYTMTAAAGKNAIEIKSYGFENRTERAALTINAKTDEIDPNKIGTIHAGTKSCIYYKYDATLAGDKYDRPIIYIKGGVYEGSSYSGISSTGHNTAQDKCATFNISGGTFNCGLNLTKTKLLTSGGLFNKSVSCTGGSTSIRLISGGTFKSWGWMTADASSKFAVGTAINNYNVGVYVDDNGYLVVGGDVITEEGTTFEASTANYSGWSSYLEYSSAATNDLYYTSVEEALADNNNTTSSVNIYVSELDLTGTSYKGTLVITEPLTVTFPEGTTPAWKVASGEDGHEVGYTESVENGVVTRVYTLFTPVAQVGEVKYESLDAAFAAAQEGETITMLADVTEEFDINNMANVTFDMDGHTLTGAITPSKANVTIKKGTIINENSGVSAIEINEGSLVLNNDVVIKSARHALRIDGNVAVTINGGEYKAAIGNGTGTYHALNVSGTAVVTIVDGTFVGPKGTSADSGAAVNVQTGATVSISGGNFSGGKNNTLVSKGVLTLTGGTYDQDVNVFCADGYAAITNDNATWTVIEALTRNLEEGWNWFSSYVVADAEDVQEALGENGLQIKSQLGFSQYIEYNGMKFWDGTITENPSVGMYMIKTSQAHEMTLVGNHVDPSQTPITIHKNWTWIAYPMTVETNISDAINFIPEVGDQIKGRNGFACYWGETTGWQGEINTIVPGQGYMYYSKAEDTKTLKYSYPQAGSRSALKSNVTSENNHWVADAYQYANNMTMLATVDVEGGDYEVAAFVNGEVRGSSRPIYVESLDTYMLFLTIHGDEVEEMTFKMYDLTTGEEYAFDNRMNYSSDAIVGSIEEPYMLTCSTLGIGETSLSEINIYPNPTTIGREINLGTECEMVEVFNTLGAKVAEYQNVDRIDAFETAGVYVIRVTDNNEVKHCRLVVK